MEMTSKGLGTLLIIGGIGVVIVGVLVWAGAFSWFGRLPGDIRIGGDNVRVYVPLTSMIVISVVITIAVNVLRRIL